MTAKLLRKRAFVKGTTLSSLSSLWFYHRYLFLKQELFLPFGKVTIKPSFQLDLPKIFTLFY